MYIRHHARRKPETTPHPISPKTALSQPAPRDIRRGLPVDGLPVSGLWRGRLSCVGMLFLPGLRLGTLQLSCVREHGGTNGAISSSDRSVLSTELAGARYSQARSDLCRASGQVHRELAREYRHGVLVDQPIHRMRVRMYVLLCTLRTSVHGRAGPRQRTGGG